MRQSPARYECQAFPDGTWSVVYIDLGGEQAETIGSGRVPEACRAMGESGLEAAKQWARELVRDRKAEAAERARLTNGAITFTIKA